MQDQHGTSIAAQTATGVLALLGSAYFRRTGLPEGGAWLAELAVTVLLLPIAHALDRLARRYPGQSFPVLLRKRLKPSLAFPLIALMTLPVLISGFFAAWEFAVFVHIETLYHTAAALIAVFLLCTASALTASDTNGTLRCCGLLFPGALLLIGTLQGFSLLYLEASNFSLGITDMTALLQFGFRLLLMPTCLLLPLSSVFCAYPSRNTKIGPLVRSVLIAGLIIALAFLADELVLSPSVVAILDFPTYVRSSCIGIGDFFQHIEILSAFLFQISAIVVLTLDLLWLKALLPKRILTLGNRGFQKTVRKP